MSLYSSVAASSSASFDFRAAAGQSLLEGLADDVLDDDVELSGEEKIEERAGEEKDLEAVEQLLEPAVNDHFDTLASQTAHNVDLDIPAMPALLSPSFRSSLFMVDVGVSHTPERDLDVDTRTSSAALSGSRRSDRQKPSGGQASPRDSPPAALVPPRAAHRRRPHNTPPLDYFDVTLVGVEVAELEPSAETTLLKWEVTKLTKGVTARDKKLGEMSEEFRRKAKGKEEMKHKIDEGGNEEKETWRMRVNVWSMCWRR
ncbi:hypothetical protein JCM21900_003069 [Sporobolomyces salmonicolor]